MFLLRLKFYKWIFLSKLGKHKLLVNIKTLISLNTRLKCTINYFSILETFLIKSPNFVLSRCPALPHSWTSSPFWPWVLPHPLPLQPPAVTGALAGDRDQDWGLEDQWGGGLKGSRVLSGARLEAMEKRRNASIYE